MVKMKTLHFVNVRVGRKVMTASQHRKKSVAMKKLAALKKKGFKGKIVTKRDRWVY